MPHGGADLHSELVEQAQHGEYPAELTLWEIGELIWLGGDHQADPTGQSVVRIPFLSVGAIALDAAASPASCS